MHKFILMFAILATISMSSLAVAQRPDGARGEGRTRGGAQPEGGGRRGGGQRPTSPMMTALDSNNDGKLSAEEIANSATALMTLDKNQDGVLDATELNPPRGGRGGGFVERVMQRDTDKDGKVSKEEAGERMAGFFDRIDADGDGFLTKTEIEKMAEQGPRGGGGGGRGGQGQPSTRKERPAFDE